MVDVGSWFRLCSLSSKINQNLRPRTIENRSTFTSNTDERVVKDLLNGSGQATSVWIQIFNLILSDIRYFMLTSALYREGFAIFSPTRKAIANELNSAKRLRLYTRIYLQFGELQVWWVAGFTFKSNAFIYIYVWISILSIYTGLYTYTIKKQARYFMVQTLPN